MTLSYFQLHEGPRKVTGSAGKVETHPPISKKSTGRKSEQANFLADHHGAVLTLMQGNMDPIITKSEWVGQLLIGYKVFLFNHRPTYRLKFIGYGDQCGVSD